MHGTTHLHTLWPAYPGERVRLLEKISSDHRVVQESEGAVIIVVPDPAEVQDLTTGEVALQYCPQGVWVCVGDCKVAPLAGKLESKIDLSDREALWRLIALHPSSTKRPGRQDKECP